MMLVVILCHVVLQSRHWAPPAPVHYGTTKPAAIRGDTHRWPALYRDSARLPRGTIILYVLARADYQFSPAKPMAFGFFVFHKRGLVLIFSAARIQTK